MDCGNEKCGENVSITDYLVNAQKGSWQELSIDLNCFADQLSVYENITSVFSISSSKALDISIANIKVVPTKGKPNISEAKYSCL